MLNPDHFLRCSIDEFLEDAWPSQLRPTHTWKDDASLLPQVNPKGKGRDQEAEGRKRQPLQNLSNCDAPPVKKARQETATPAEEKANSPNENVKV